MQGQPPLTIPPGQEERLIHSLEGPVVPITTEWDNVSGDSEELSILSPVSNLILGYDTGELTDGARDQYLRPRLDSVVIPPEPNWNEHRRQGELSTGMELHLMPQSHSAV